MLWIDSIVTRKGLALSLVVLGTVVSVWLTGCSARESTSEKGRPTGDGAAANSSGVFEWKKILARGRDLHEWPAHQLESPKLVVMRYRDRVLRKRNGAYEEITQAYWENFWNYEKESIGLATVLRMYVVWGKEPLVMKTLELACGRLREMGPQGVADFLMGKDATLPDPILEAARGAAGLPRTGRYEEGSWAYVRLVVSGKTGGEGVSIVADVGTILADGERSAYAIRPGNDALSRQVLSAFGECGDMRVTVHVVSREAGGFPTRQGMKGRPFVRVTTEAGPFVGTGFDNLGSLLSGSGDRLVWARFYAAGLGQAAMVWREEDDKFGSLIRYTVVDQVFAR